MPPSANPGAESQQSQSLRQAAEGARVFTNRPNTGAAAMSTLAAQAVTRMFRRPKESSRALSQNIQERSSRPKPAPRSRPTGASPSPKQRPYKPTPESVQQYNRQVRSPPNVHKPGQHTPHVQRSKPSPQKPPPSQDFEPPERRTSPIASHPDPTGGRSTRLDPDNFFDREFGYGSAVEPPENQESLLSDAESSMLANSLMQGHEELTEEAYKRLRPIDQQALDRHFAEEPEEPQKEQMVTVPVGGGSSPEHPDARATARRVAQNLTRVPVDTAPHANDFDLADPPKEITNNLWRVTSLDPMGVKRNLDYIRDRSGGQLPEHLHKPYADLVGMLEGTGSGDKNTQRHLLAYIDALANNPRKAKQLEPWYENMRRQHMGSLQGEP